MNKRTKQAITAGVVATSFMVAGTSLAHSGGLMGKGFMSDEAKAALENNDYEAFVQALPEGRTITEEKFEEKVEFFEAVQSGDEEKIEELREAKRAERQAQKDALHQAISDGDYDEFVELLGDRGENITEDHFETIVEIHQAREGGDTDRVKELREELKESGVKLPGHGRFKGGHRELEDK